MSERNYGKLNGAGSSGTISSPIKRSQVYLATHEGSGERRLPYMNRSFISFRFGDRNIEDFNLIATFSDTGMD